MEAPEGEAVQQEQSKDLMRKKLEAELRATEEIARIRQSVIEKRLAVELATLGEKPPGGLRVQQPQQQERAPPYSKMSEMASVKQRRRQGRRRDILSESDVYIQEDSQDDISDESEVEEEIFQQSPPIRKRASFFKGVMRKFKRRLRSAEREMG